jgi:antitoxin StbD
MPATRDRSAAPAEVLPTSEARKALSKTSREFEEKGAKAKPVFFGAHRRPAGVMLSYERYLQLLDRIDDLAIALQVRLRDRDDDGTRLSVDEVLEDLGFEREELEAQIRAEDEEAADTT